MKSKIKITNPECHSDFEQILELQQSNLAKALSPEELHKEGFVTVQHDLELLIELSKRFPHVLAKDAEKVIGYTLVMEESFRDRIPVLIPMFKIYDNLYWKNKPLRDWRYFVMGQVCIAKAYRGKGLFQLLYKKLIKQMQPHFDLMLTEVAQRNPRSLKAHEKVGFQPLHQYEAKGEYWHIIVHDLHT